MKRPILLPAFALLHLPPVPGMEGLVLSFAYTLQPFVFTSNPVSVELLP